MRDIHSNPLALPLTLASHMQWQFVFKTISSSKVEINAKYYFTVHFLAQKGKKGSSALQIPTG
jgi:hypothetical protein